MRQLLWQQRLRAPRCVFWVPVTKGAQPQRQYQEAQGKGQCILPQQHLSRQDINVQLAKPGPVKHQKESSDDTTNILLAHEPSSTFHSIFAHCWHKQSSEAAPSCRRHQCNCKQQSTHPVMQWRGPPHTPRHPSSLSPSSHPALKSPMVVIRLLTSCE